MPGVTIQIIGDTEQAQQALDKFFKGANEAFEKIIGFKEGLETLGKRIVEVFSVTELVKLGREAINTTDEMGKMAEALRVNVSSLSVWQYGMRQANYGQAELQIGLRSLSGLIADASRGSQEAQESFNRAGVSFRNADGSARSLEEAFTDIVGVLGKLPDKVDLANKFFGRADVAFLKAFKDDLGAMAEAAKKAGQVISEDAAKGAEEFNTRLKDLELSLKGIVAEIVTGFLPAMNKTLKAMQENRDAIQPAKEAAAIMSVLVKTVITVFRALYEVLSAVGTIGGAQLKLLFDGLTSVWNTWKPIWAAMAETVSVVVGRIVQAAKAIGDLAGALNKIRQGKFSEGLDDYNAALDRLMNVGAGAPAAIGSAWMTAFKAIGSAVKAFRDATVSNWDGLKNTLMDDATSAWKAIKALWAGDPPKPKEEGPAKPPDVPLRNLLKEKQYIDELAKLTAEAFQGRRALLDVEYNQQVERIDREITDEQVASDIKFGLAKILVKKKLDLAREEEAARLQIVLAGKQSQVADIEADKDKDQLEKKKLLIPLLQDETALITAQIKALQERLAGPMTEEGQIEAEKQIVALETQRVELQRKLKDLQAQTFSGQMRQGLAQLATEWGNLGANLANGVMGGIRDAIGGVGDAIVGVINHTKTWGQVFAQVGDRIIASLINIVIQWIANMTIVAALRKIFGLSDKTEAASMASAWAPAAIAASIASYGTAALVGTSAYATALIAGTALTSGMAVAAFAKGGRIPGGKQLIQANEEGQEFVFSAPAYGKAAPFIEALHAGLRNGYDLATAIQAALPTPFTANQGLPIGSGSGSVNVSPAPVTVAVLNNENQLRRFMESQAAKQIIFKHINEDPRGVGLTR